MLQTDLKFKRGKKRYSFKLVHNLDEMGLDIEAALVNWAARTHNFSVNSFIEYVRSKDPVNIFMVTQRYFDLLEAEIENK